GSTAALRAHADGAPLGPRAAFTKLWLSTAEQTAADWVLAVDPDLAVGAQEPGTALHREEYLFSRIVTVYGGSQQMQLETIAKQILRLPRAPGRSRARRERRHPPRRRRVPRRGRPGVPDLDRWRRARRPRVVVAARRPRRPG